MKHYKRPELLPTFKKTDKTKYLHGVESDTISDTTIVIGDEIEKCGNDLPSGRNYADYFKIGTFEYIRFWVDHLKDFPKLWSYAVEIASCNPTEVSCESLFSQSGYASNSRRTKLKSRQFEREVIIANNLQKVYFDIDHAIEIFMEQERKKDWNDEEL
jgi:hypothetical protein